VSTTERIPGGELPAAGSPGPELLEAELAELVDHLVEELPGGRETLGPLLRLVVERLGHVPPAAQERLAHRLGLSPIEVAGVVSFSTCFSSSPRGRHHLEVCLGTGCAVERGGRLLDAARHCLGIEPGGVTGDRRFSLAVVRCLGACEASPAVRLDGRIHGPLTPGGLRTLLDRLRSEVPPGRDDGVGGV
jgi:NADH:ubiquinone oxidoreductase subunit E